MFGVKRKSRGVGLFWIHVASFKSDSSPKSQEELYILLAVTGCHDMVTGHCHHFLSTRKLSVPVTDDI